MARVDRPDAAGPPRRRGTLLTAVVAGFAGGLIAPLLYPAISRNARPAARRTLKTGIAVFERGRLAIAELAEHASDLAAEARAEYEQDIAGGNSPDAARMSEIVSFRGSRQEAGNN